MALISLNSAISLSNGITASAPASPTNALVGCVTIPPVARAVSFSPPPDEPNKGVIALPKAPAASGKAPIKFLRSHSPPKLPTKVPIGPPTTVPIAPPKIAPKPPATILPTF